jgi:hypothetical protein
MSLPVPLLDRDGQQYHGGGLLLPGSTQLAYPQAASVATDGNGNPIAIQAVTLTGGILNADYVSASSTFVGSAGGSVTLPGVTGRTLHLIKVLFSLASGITLTASATMTLTGLLGGTHTVQLSAIANGLVLSVDNWNNFPASGQNIPLLATISAFSLLGGNVSVSLFGYYTTP